MGDFKILLGELKEFKSATAERMIAMDAKIDRLLEFKWRVIGVAGLCAFVATLVVEYVRH